MLKEVFVTVDQAVDYIDESQGSSDQLEWQVHCQVVLEEGFVVGFLLVHDTVELKDAVLHVRH